MGTPESPQGEPSWKRFILGRKKPDSAKENKQFDAALETARTAFAATKDHDILRTLSGCLVIDTADGKTALIAVSEVTPSVAEPGSALPTIGSQWHGQLPFPGGMDVVIPTNDIPTLSQAVQTTIQKARRIESIGYTHQIIDLANPEFQANLNRLQQWYQDENLPMLQEGLQGVTKEDYKRWEQTTYERESGFGSYIDHRGRAFQYFLGSDKLGGDTYKHARELAVNHLRGALGPSHMNDRFVREMGRGKVPEYQPSPALHHAITVLDARYPQRPIPREMLGTASIITDIIAAPAHERDVLMSGNMKDNEYSLNAQIAQAEVLRLVLIKQLDK